MKIAISAGYKKALATLIGSLVMTFHEFLGLSMEEAQNIAMLIGTYIIGQSAVDFNKYKAEKSA